MSTVGWRTANCANRRAPTCLGMLGLGQNHADERIREIVAFVSNASSAEQTAREYSNAHRSEYCAGTNWYLFDVTAK